MQRRIQSVFHCIQCSRSLSSVNNPCRPPLRRFSSATDWGRPSSRWGSFCGGTGPRLYVMFSTRHDKTVCVPPPPPCPEKCKPPPPHAEKKKPPPSEDSESCPNIMDLMEKFCPWSFPMLKDTLTLICGVVVFSLSLFTFAVVNKNLLFRRKRFADDDR